MTFRALLILSVFAGLAVTSAAAQTAPAKTPPAKTPAAKAPAAKAPATKAPATKAPAGKAPATKAAPAAGPFDATNPQGIMDLLGAAGAKVQTGRKEEDSVFVTVTSPAASFSMQFAGCSPQGRACRAVLMDSVMTRSTATISQINAFNQTSVMCRIYQDRGGMPHVLYSAILSRSMTRDDAGTHLLAWQGCLADGTEFLRDPVAYLSSAA